MKFAIQFKHFTLGFWGLALLLVAQQYALANSPNPSGYGQMTPWVEPIPGGAKLTAKFHHYTTGNPVSLSLLAIVTDPVGGNKLIELKRIDDSYTHSATDYNTERSIELIYADVNAELKKNAPNLNLQIGPGTEVFLYARWMFVGGDMYTNNQTINNRWNHQWGGISRNGKVVLPVPLHGTSVGGANSNASVSSVFTPGGITTALDVANSISASLASRYPGLTPSKTIGSRFENELKLHVDLNDISRIENYLRNLAQNPTQVEILFGKGWQLTEDRTYVGQPMVDVYLDNQKNDGFKIGMALRFRSGKGITSLNYKPNDGQYMGGAVTARIEYQVEGVTQVQHFQVFMDSFDPMNPLQLIRDKIPGAVPSDFTIQKLNLTDERLKFHLKAPTGDEVEFSLDHVKSSEIDGKGQMIGPTAEFGQLEVEVNHLGAKGSVNIVNQGNSQAYISESTTLHGTQLIQYLSQLNSKATLAGELPPQFHGELDFASNSPIRTANAQNFKLAYDVFDKVRDALFPNNTWISSGQKAALSAAALGMVEAEDYAPSVKQMLREHLKDNSATPQQMKACLGLLVKVSNPGV